MSDGIENGGMTLASIAGLDVSEVEEIRASRIGAGLYTFEVTKGFVEERMVKDNTELRYCPTIELKVIEVDAVTETGFDAAEMMGKTHSENWFINPSDNEAALKTIGYLKGFVKDIGCDNAGAMGGIEGQPPGFLDKAVTHRFKAKMIAKKDRDGEMRSRLQLIKAKAA